MLAERDEDSHTDLTRQLSEAGLSDKLVGGRVLREARDVGGAIDQIRQTVESDEGLFGLIDPFTVDEDRWGAVLDGIHRALKPGARGIVIAFTFGKHDWPVDLTPATNLRRTRKIKEGAYNLAAYATDGLAEDVAQLLDRFGWG